VRYLPGHLAASVAGIVVSASLCVAMAIMVFSFRVSLEDWLNGVVGADLYVQSPSTASPFSAGDLRLIESLPEVASVEALRFDRLVLDAQGPPVTLIARPINQRILDGFQAEPRGMPRPATEIPCGSRKRRATCTAGRRASASCCRSPGATRRCGWPG
jgi:putative ABC transport system permease protein